MNSPERTDRSEPDTRARAAVRPTRYEVSVLPEGDINRRHYTIYVEYRGNEQWAVHDGFASLAVDGTWSEGLKSYGRYGWVERHLFGLVTALRLAEEAAPGVTVNGVTAAQVLARSRAEGSDR
ncbi:MAG TPA: hypothetical protein VFY14_14280 [Streptomyces sp.]|nr:hypothetical protein [Streptomyces sp.]